MAAIFPGGDELMSVLVDGCVPYTKHSMNNLRKKYRFVDMFRQ